MIRCMSYYKKQPEAWHSRPNDIHIKQSSPEKNPNYLPFIQYIAHLAQEKVRIHLFWPLKNEISKEGDSEKFSVGILYALIGWYTPGDTFYITEST